MVNIRKLCSGVIIATMCAVLIPSAAKADKIASGNMKISYGVRAVGQYTNWDGVSNVAQFSDNKGNYYFAYDGDSKITVVKTKSRKKLETITLKKKYPLFGTVTCDAEGNYYVVTGRENTGNDTSKKTIFVSKYDKKGKYISSAGDDGRSSLDYYYSESFNTKKPFNAGNCDATMYGNILVVNYAREMYSGHQSNSMFAVNTKTMKKTSLGHYYNSHSFAQRVTVAGDKVILASEGDCYDRAFTISITDKNTKTVKNYDIFDFWVPKGTLDSYDMYVLNNNFAHMGGVAAIDEKYVAFVGTSAKSLNSNAKKETERLFVQVFDARKDLTKESAYYTSGTRKGLAGPNGDKSVVNYGVKWLTDGSESIISPQVVADSQGRFIVLYEKGSIYNYKGTYYMVLSKRGRVLKGETKYSSTARLNQCRMPVCEGKTIYWTGNKYGDSSNNLYVYSLKIE